MPGFDTAKVFTLEPDWPLVLVYSDWLDQEGRQREAAILRWLYRWDHWPYYRSPFSYNDQICWWVSCPSFDYSFSRYRRSALDKTFPPQSDILIQEAQRVIRATLPPIGLATVGTVAFHSTQEAIVFLFDATSDGTEAVDEIVVPAFRPEIAKHFTYLPREVSLEKAIAAAQEAKK